MATLLAKFPLDSSGYNMYIIYVTKMYTTSIPPHRSSPQYAKSKF